MSKRVIELHFMAYVWRMMVLMEPKTPFFTGKSELQVLWIQKWRRGREIGHMGMATVTART